MKTSKAIIFGIGFIALSIYELVMVFRFNPNRAYDGANKLYEYIRKRDAIRLFIFFALIGIGLLLYAYIGLKIWKAINKIF
ncbi:MAG: hypothetical protein MJ148_00970 [Clostridia bacterium]|nr:hypothetical protein [Clostridia bacterium]